MERVGKIPYSLIPETIVPTIAAIAASKTTPPEEAEKQEQNDQYNDDHPTNAKATKGPERAATRFL